jgi:prolyl 4-hydroxylase
MNSEVSNIKIQVSEKTKINNLHNDPEIYTIENLLTDDECDHFINISKNNFEQSLVADPTGRTRGVQSKGRTSENTWIKHNHDEITLRIANKIANLVKMPLENAESFQVVHYNVSQEYRPHYDSWEHNYSEKTLRNMEKGGARLKTALVYLNNVEEGGATKMTKLNIAVSPEKGKLLVFNNTLKDSHNRHHLSEHAGMPVLKGEKYIFNLWFRECKRWSLYKNFNPSYYDILNKLPIPPKEIVDDNSNAPPNSPAEKKYEGIINLDEKPKNTVDKVNTITHAQFHLEEGDFLPFTGVPFVTGHKKELYNYVDDNEFLIIHLKDIGEIKTIKKFNNFNYIILFKDGEPESNIKGMCSKDSILYGLFKKTDTISVYLTTPNRKIYKTYQFNTIEEFNKENIVKSFIQPSNIPYLLIDNVFSPQLLKKVLDFYDNNKHKHTPHYTATKNRLHVHPDRDLEIEIDNKLSRSVFPEIRKIFYFDVHHRENYKICCYDAETGGRFHPHRDTPAPYQHRRYAMSLFLNDDYEGGEFELPEYNFKIKPKANCALIFPGISSHKVNQVTKGTRRVIITFFCSEIEGKTKNNCNYQVKSHFFKQHNIKYGPIFPK